MKPALVSCLFLIAVQILQAQHKTFLRAYNAGGNKIGKGYFVNTTDSSILLEKGSKVIEIPAAQIDLIKSKRTTASRIAATSGKVVLIATVVVAVIYVALVLTTHNRIHDSNSENKDEPKKTKKVKPLKKYIISNSLLKWQEQRILLNQLW